MKKLFAAIFLISVIFIVSCGQKTIVSEVNTIAELTTEEKQILLDEFSETITFTKEFIEKGTETITATDEEKGESIQKSDLANAQIRFPNLKEEDIMIFIERELIKQIPPEVLAKEMNTSQQRAKDSNRIIALKTIQTALATYYTDFGIYPENFEDKEFKIFFRNEEVPTDETGTAFEYTAVTKNGVKNAGYIVSTSLLSDKHISTMKEDGGPDDEKYEIGSDF